MWHILIFYSIYIYFFKENWLYQAALVCIYVGRKSGKRKGEYFQANIDKDKISHLQEGIKAKAC